MVADFAGAAGAKSPLIVPFAFFGMEKTFPYGRNGTWQRYRPYFGQRVRGVVGEPFDSSELVARFERLCAANPGWGDPWPPNREELHAAITRRAEIETLKLYAQLRAANAAEIEAERDGRAFDGEAFLASLPPLRDDQVPNSVPRVDTHERTFVAAPSMPPGAPHVLSLPRYLHSRATLQLFNPPLVYAAAPPLHALVRQAPPHAPSPAMAVRGGPPLFADADNDSSSAAISTTGSLPAEVSLATLTVRWRRRVRAWVASRARSDGDGDRGAATVSPCHRGTGAFFDAVARVVAADQA